MSSDHDNTVDVLDGKNLPEGFHIPPLTLGLKIFYGIGSAAYGIKNIAFATYLLLFYNLVVGMPAHMVGLAILIALVFDAISDPIVGQISDNLKTRWGRRHPLMYASAIPAALSFLLLWIPPEGLSDKQLFVYLVVVACAVRTFITLYEIPSSALAPELARDYDERTSIATFRYFFGYMGYFGMSFIMLFVFLAPTKEFPIGQMNPDGYWKFGLLGAFLMFVMVILSTVGTHSRIKYLRQPDPQPRRGFVGSLKHIKKTFSHKGFGAVMSYGLLKFTALGMSGALSLYFGTFYWEFTNVQLALLTAEYILAACIALALAPYMTKRFGKRNSVVVLAVLAVVFMSIPFLLRFNGMMFENGDKRLWWTIFACSSVYATCGAAASATVHAMIGDLADEMSLRTGDRSEGLFYSANSFMQKSVSGLGAFAAGLLLAAVNFPDEKRPQSVDPEIMDALAHAYLPTLCFLYVVGVSFLYFYRLDRSSQEENLKKLSKRRAARMMREAAEATAEQSE